jgi:hypothetical protein
MPIQRNQPSPQRQTVLTFVSPNVKDLLFFETVDAQRVGNTPPVYGTAHPDSAQFPDHTLAYVKQADPNGQLYYYYYANTRTSQDEYNFEYSQASLGSTKFDTVKRTYIHLRSTFTEDDSTNVAGSAMPTEPASANFSGKGYILMGREQKRIGDSELDGIFVVEQRMYFVRENIESLAWDELSHRNLKSTISYFYKGETPTGAGATIQALIVDSDNTWWKPTRTTLSGTEAIASYRQGKQVSSDWFEVVKKELVAGAPLGSNAITVDTYFSSIDHTFPPVLESVNVASWERQDGQLLTFPEYNMNPEGYSGPCKVRIDTFWSPTPFSGVGAVAMLPQSFTMGTPYVRINIPKCLSAGGNIRISTGTRDPVYKYAGYDKQIPSTNPPAWPDSIKVRDKQEPARGGYIRTSWTVYPPSFT